MAIQWFPGHMNLTRKAIAERIKDIDVVIEVLDARLPGSSANPLLAEMTAADPARTALWLAHYNAQAGTRALAMQASDAGATQPLAAACQALAPGRGGLAKPMRVLICGVPNVGKSTLINNLTGKHHAKTGDEAGITKLEQRITLADDFYLYDTPGLLWPRIIVAQSGFNLAASGAIGRNAYDEEEVALELLDRLRQDYPHLLEARYKLTGVAAMKDEEVLEAVGRQRGGLLSGGRINTQKAAEVVITEFRTATLGRVTLETPQEFEQWLAAGRQLDAQRLAKKEARAAGKKGSGKKEPPPPTAE
jgi:ribosome biogenesis GTPase A